MTNPRYLDYMRETYEIDSFSGKLLINENNVEKIFKAEEALEKSNLTKAQKAGFNEALEKTDAWTNAKEHVKERLDNIIKNEDPKSKEAVLNSITRSETLRKNIKKKLFDMEDYVGKELNERAYEQYRETLNANKDNLAEIEKAQKLLKKDTRLLGAEHDKLVLQYNRTINILEEKEAKIEREKIGGKFVPKGTEGATKVLISKPGKQEKTTEAYWKRIIAENAEAGKIDIVNGKLITKPGINATKQDIKKLEKIKREYDKLIDTKAETRFIQYNERLLDKNPYNKAIEEKTSELLQEAKAAEALHAAYPEARELKGYVSNLERLQSELHNLEQSSERFNKKASEYKKKFGSSSPENLTQQVKNIPFFELKKDKDKKDKDKKAIQSWDFQKGVNKRFKELTDILGGRERVYEEVTEKKKNVKVEDIVRDITTLPKDVRQKLKFAEGEGLKAKKTTLIKYLPKDITEKLTPEQIADMKVKQAEKEAQIKANIEAYKPGTGVDVDKGLPFKPTAAPKQKKKKGEFDYESLWKVEDEEREEAERRRGGYRRRKDKDKSRQRTLKGY